jgi:hypothetical protein
MHGDMRQAIPATPAGTAKRQAASAQPGGTAENTRPGSPERAGHRAGLPSGSRVPCNAGKRARLPASCQFVKQANPAAAAGDSVDYEAHAGLLRDLKSRLAPCFKRPETRRTRGEMTGALLMELEDHNCWTMSGAAGHATPGRMQRFLSRAAVDDEKMAGEIAKWAAAQVTAGTDPAGVILAIGETAGHALIGRSLYLPKDWAADEERRELAGIPATSRSRPSPSSRATWASAAASPPEAKPAADLSSARGSAAAAAPTSSPSAPTTWSPCPPAAAPA